MNVAVHFPNACIEMSFVPFLCTDKVPVLDLEDTFYLGKEVIFCFSVISRARCDAMTKRKRSRRVTESKLERSIFRRPVHVVVVSRRSRRTVDVPIVFLLLSVAAEYKKKKPGCTGRLDC